MRRVVEQIVVAVKNRLTAITAAKFGAAIIGTFVLVVHTNAETIKSAMARAYQGNPEINAQRAATRAADEGIPLARSGYLPTVIGNADYGFSHSTYSSGAIRTHTDLNPHGFGVTISQTLFDGLKTRNNVYAA